ncbi:hypothetical protein IMG5_100790 [Ichthyophthirius multifiliis]|uniref:Uncharacterized protein n=1 Tax=Ichthyophthirius multifiliis TaxID=5932 RepID=G0QSF6_ICHMU|nr:hypothetical protein IMG5_100790 [Ichthyophthirius multifiliis]EGR31857.1 hypothetical protein IMG5_100790 [Ichthyophthirius multifiliis]|eukprot:XP_004035343.1 hypothetical protein IMG5_100790 [Ichthyophthirius multifiliis]
MSSFQKRIVKIKKLKDKIIKNKFNQILNIQNKKKEKKQYKIFGVLNKTKVLIEIYKSQKLDMLYYLQVDKVIILVIKTIKKLYNKQQKWKMKNQSKNCFQKRKLK